MTTLQTLFLVMLGCFAVAVVLTLVVQIKMWNTNIINWLVPIILLFYGGAIGSCLALGFVALGHVS